MSTILENPIKVNKIVTTSLEHARAIEDPARAKIMEILYKKTMSAEQIGNALKKNGYKTCDTVAKRFGNIGQVFLQETFTDRQIHQNIRAGDPLL